MKKKFAETREEMLLSLYNRKEPQAIDEFYCYNYSHKFNGGCAIGCQVTAKEAKKLEEVGGDVYGVFDYLPDRLKEMGDDFLQDLQEIHDWPYNWLSEPDENGIWWNKEGIERMNGVIKKFDLKLKPFK